MDAGAWLGLATALFTVIVVLISTVLTVVVTIASIALPLWLVFKLLAQSEERKRKLMAEGIAAPARVLSLAETGTYINHQPMVRIALEVAPPEGEPFQATVDRVTSIVEIPRLQPGSVVEVRYEAGNPKNLLISSLGQP